MGGTAAELLHVIGVATPYAWDVVESVRRLGREPVCVDNFGGADPRFPNLMAMHDVVERSVPFTLGLSSATHRSDALLALAGDGFTDPVAVVDPTAIVASTSLIGHGAYINAGVVIAANTAVGCAANVNRSASLGHDVTIGWGASIGPGVTTGGHVTVGANSLVGVGAVLLPGVVVGRRCTVGAGAVVTKDVPDGAIVVGNPARARVPATAAPYREVARCPYC
jgi:sugar O-acyltransferase (sialic acid O-acetyltransferase NeuD family)